MKRKDKDNGNKFDLCLSRGVLLAVCLLLVFPFGYLSPSASAQYLQSTIASQSEQPEESDMQDKTVFVDGEIGLAVDSIGNSGIDEYGYDEKGKIPFDPSPTRAVWLSVLCPGLGQIYNRRYWKLPIVIGGFMGLGYATNWNNNQYQDYAQGYQDLMDNDPSTKSYMDFFPPTVQESDLDKTWLTNLLKSRKDYFRRNRDLCIIGMVGVYLLAMVDAYVDASLSHFDISPDLSIDLTPSLIPDARNTLPGVGMTWAFNF